MSRTTPGQRRLPGARVLPAGQLWVRVRLGKIGRIRTELAGSPCLDCGSTRYQVVLQQAGEGQVEPVAGRCPRCHAMRNVDSEGSTGVLTRRFGARLKPRLASACPLVRRPSPLGDAHPGPLVDGSPAQPARD